MLLIKLGSNFSQVKGNIDHRYTLESNEDINELVLGNYLGLCAHISLQLKWDRRINKKGHLALIG